MTDLRFRSFRLKTYARLLPVGTDASARERFFRLMEASDEDGMAMFFREIPAGAHLSRALDILQEAREIGDRLNVMDRTLPVLPHAEIAASYSRLRSIGDELANLEAAGSLSA